MEGLLMERKGNSESFEVSSTFWEITRMGLFESYIKIELGLLDFSPLIGETLPKYSVITRLALVFMLVIISQ